MLLDRVTSAPVGEGAGPLKVTAIVAAPPLISVLGLIVMELSVGPVPEGGVTVRSAVRLDPPQVAVSVTTVEAVTFPNWMVVLALLWPAGTTSDEGAGKTAGLLLDRATATPPGAGAGPLRVTLRIAEPPLVTETVFRLRFDNATAV